MSGKILVLELWAKMLSANQVTKFFQVYYFKKELRDQTDVDACRCI